MLNHQLLTWFFVPLGRFGLEFCLQRTTRFFSKLISLKKTLTTKSFERRDRRRVVGIVRLAHLGELNFMRRVDVVTLDDALFVTKNLEAAWGAGLIPHLVFPNLSLVVPAGLLLYLGVRWSEVCRLVALPRHWIIQNYSVCYPSHWDHIVHGLLWRTIRSVFVSIRLWILNARFGWTL